MDTQPLWQDSPVHADILDKPLSSLQNGEVFVFGSNSTGFHGAGAAGAACRGDAGKGWRTDEWFQNAMKAEPGSEQRIGKWAVFGVARGYQEGREGASYAIETIRKPGVLCSTPLKEIYIQLRELVTFAEERPELRFVISPLAEKLAGYTKEEMQLVWKTLYERVGIPASFRFVRVAEKQVRKRKVL